MACARCPRAAPARERASWPNRFDDPRPNAENRYLVRYFATTLRGGLLEALAWLRPDEQATQHLQVVAGAGGDKEPQLADAVADYLATRKVAMCTFPNEVLFVDIHAPEALAVLDTNLNVEPLLTAPRGRVALGEGNRRPHLDQAAVLLASSFGRDVTRHCSLAIWDAEALYSGIAYRSRHDLVEWCWAAFDRTAVEFADSAQLSPDVEDHFEAVGAVAEMWQLPIQGWGRPVTRRRGNSRSPMVRSAGVRHYSSLC
ncbi:MAG: RES domain-containing protein [Acidobacteria bacterium]|nr:RES domain-containing protein [Acidobacteriota bacterium]